MSDWKEVSLDNLAGGCAVWRFNEALREVIENILDLDTPAEKTREVRLILKINPEQDRLKAHYQLIIDKKIAAPMKVESILFVTNKEGHPIVYEQDITQGKLFEAEKPDLTLVEEHQD